MCVVPGVRTDGGFHRSHRGIQKGPACEPPGDRFITGRLRIDREGEYCIVHIFEVQEWRLDARVLRTGRCGCPCLWIEAVVNGTGLPLIGKCGRL